MMTVDTKQLKAKILKIAAIGFVLNISAWAVAMAIVTSITPLDLWHASNLFSFSICMSLMPIMCICQGMWFNGRFGRAWWQDHASQTSWFEWKDEWKEELRKEQQQWVKAK